MTDFISGAWLTITIVMVGYMILLGRKQNRLEIELEIEKTRSIEVDNHHDSELTAINNNINKIDHKMNQVLLAYQDTKEMLISKVNEVKRIKDETKS